MSGIHAKDHQHESDFRSDLIAACAKHYPLAHAVLIPQSFWRLLPYDVYVLYNGIYRAMELKVDENPVEAHQYKALFEVAANKGYAFVVRWMNVQKKIIVENFTLGTTEIFQVRSDRQLSGDSRIDADDKPFHRTATIKACLDYIMGFQVTPLEEQIQDIIKQNYKRLLQEIAKRGSRTKM